MILPRVRDPRLVTVRRGGSLAEETRRDECVWQRDRLPDAVRALVLEDEQRRNAICWNVFDV